MKKLLLGLGILSIAALPVLAVVSCSSDKETSKIDTEAKKLVTKVSKITNVTAAEAMSTIDTALQTDAAAAKIALETFYTDIPLATGFTYAYKSSVVDTTTDTTLNVTVTLTEAGNTTPKTVVIKITGFKATV